MDAIFQEAALDLLDEMGDLQATFTAKDTAAVPCPCLVNYNTEIIGGEFNTISFATTIEFLKSTGINPYRGDVFSADGQDFQVESILGKDSIWIKVVVK